MRIICLALAVGALVTYTGMRPDASAQTRRARVAGPDCGSDSWWSGGDRVCDTRQLTMPGGAPVEVDGGRNGGVRVRAESRGDVAIEARVVAHADTEAAARALAKQVQVTATGGRISATGPEAGDHEWWAVNFIVAVPQGTPLTVNARNGGLTLEEFTGEAQLRAVNGPVSLRNVGGDIRGETTNGPVTIDLEGPAWSGAGLNMETRNGPVRIRVPEGYSAELELETVNGPVRIDYPGVPQPPRTRRGRPSGRVVATLGSGGARIRATTVNGPVSISTR